jgi:glucose/mannose-6-phosphate isomerase
MGGSAVAGDLVADLAGPVSNIPVRVVRDFRISGLLVDENARTRQLVIICSFSGETVETLSMFDQALSKHLPIVVITGGGTLGQRASEAGVPVITIDAPGEPRSAVGYNLMLLTSLLARSGVIKASDEDVSEGLVAAKNMASQVGIDMPTEQNQAKLLAKQLIGGLTVVYGSGNLSGMALRWKSQINENGKSWAFAESLPELLHNSVESFPGALEISQRTTALLLKPHQIDPELERRYTALNEILDRCRIKSHVVTAVPGGPLAQSLALMVLGDHVSYYMGVLSGLDPSKTPSIDFLKDRLYSPGPG